MVLLNIFNYHCYLNICQLEYCWLLTTGPIIPMLTSCKLASEFSTSLFARNLSAYCACISVCLWLQKWRWAGMRQRALIVFINSLIKYVLSQMHCLALMSHYALQKNAWVELPFHTPLFTQVSQSSHYFWDFTQRYFT